ncbi:alpha/beta hydrolase [Solitalea lacus]|uniref:alpha/beta hydrolase n=1 Tax=Solitalea lacus TaxID=2911172 RepID=UPI001EDBE94B|nr:alpha/beta hydrolase [Solitalea lacus]UKJ07782.1 alpha/beta hydrolase [Solitalea lacus]
MVISSSTKAQQQILLYNHSVPNSKSSAIAEISEVGADGNLRIRNVTQPTLTVFRPADEKANGTAVIICPGGGYGLLAFSHEGTDVARLLNDWGITAFVLKYRLPSDEIMVDKSIGPLQDAQRAIQLVRARAKDWKLNVNSIGVMGFSAGGHLAASLATHFGRAFIDNPDKINLKPNFMILAYPVISFSKEIGHAGSRIALLGPEPTGEQIKLFSNEQQVSSETPPAFIMHALDDKGVSVANSTAFMGALEHNNVKFEKYFYEKGGHGFGLVNRASTIAWTAYLQNWMVKNKWIHVNSASAN